MISTSYLFSSKTTFYSLALLLLLLIQIFVVLITVDHVHVHHDIPPPKLAAHPIVKPIVEHTESVNITSSPNKLEEHPQTNTNEKINILYYIPLSSFMGKHMLVSYALNNNEHCMIITFATNKVIIK